ncbi:uncharacterized protein si:ch211-142k18.1 [Oreochromis niloticus]|uniref:uncharacterized protein si:ch211-142k18.1 n=1 Tax=Oreochromis niloticus TaxID=8128 RepID=UPI000393D657|nr:uncharacterized protein LOC102076133 [Oreochromis niloticus]XP_005460348.1 uncharacterized protein LOC102076133 [Oreochromis niloticus]CAI5683639.1 unnamed protein product [Mustela putorius furo]
MRYCWTNVILALVSMATLAQCQSGDGDWGSGFDIYSVIMATNNTLQAVGDEPAKVKNSHDWTTMAASSPSPTPELHHEPQSDRCSVHFSTNTASARRLKAQREELAYLQAIQHGNKAVMENLVQFVGDELGDQRYEDVIKENVIGIQEDQKSCHEVVEKAEEDLKKQLEGDVPDSFSGIHKIREESLAFEDMLRAAADIASRLESSAQALHTSFTKQMKDIVKIHR